MEIGQLIRQIRAAQTGTDRLIVAIIGAPASGKSTLTEALCEQLGGDAAIVPMDGFHFDDGILKERGLLTRKGAPDTFDVGGLKRTLAALREDAEDDVYVPVFDRKLEISRGSARVISHHHRVILVEGNYLLLDQAPWDQLAGLFDLSIYLEVPEETLRARLLDRWHGLGFDRQTAIAKAEHNDLPNALTVTRHSKPADITLTNG
ncbi:MULTISPECIES: nucleoside triphosphate hydrolase [Thalassospira]|uniref:Nucleoside triphosphate hydrolase n=2 Tax=Thalassospira TaxID=168934 RepID=A0A367WBK9_9PROT|nr:MULTISPECIES: nucleoside triphosphate hydrolase [Thalassospira]MDG4717724.1 nucleoside triphosphate hydrolase [Thalassospira sp. FZY0004]RCK38816.1 nucleoside triphosphate hydrolase [Thalassospira profundimaris]